ncbi:uncharacterized protein B0H18DRAFT_1113137 [Fomitopsis serialis]|uniref:uncharacterized protein n=1 Tax=Fomitopsis serialis TaxID=139415 RepID=UPI002007B36D|nr:uncharacterized protein B0H18DRAFT_1113137 [Neoantrodia serialis]KAH9937281.1 hypothetical protein B0H18DRAFT_1113137 [Neoantrodia serialis]
MSLRSNIPTPPPLDGEEDKTSVDKQSSHVATSSQSAQYERKMGDTELSYFLPSRHTGVNDMYLHLAFDAPLHLLRRARVCLVWAILRLRHPLLSAKVVMHDYDDVRFVYDVPSDPEDALVSAEAALEFRSQTKDELVDSYLNGPRTLSNSRLSYLVISQPALSAIPTPPRTPSPSRDGFTATEDLARSTALQTNPDASIGRFDVLFAAMHFLGDGMALHQCANDFFGLVACGKGDDELAQMLADEWEKRFAIAAVHSDSALPVPLEAGSLNPAHGCRRLPPRLISDSQRVPWSEARRSQNGNTRPPHRLAEQGLSFRPDEGDPEEVQAEGDGRGEAELPTMMYSALNLRPYFTPTKLLHDSYWFLAIGYFNVILPSFLPSSDQEKTFWHRARQAKSQSIQAAKNKMIVSRTREMAQERAERSRCGRRKTTRGNGAPGSRRLLPCVPSVKDILPVRPSAPSSALMGLSLLGNLDAMYTAAAYPDLKLRG